MKYPNLVETPDIPACPTHWRTPDGGLVGDLTKDKSLVLCLLDVQDFSILGQILHKFVSTAIDDGEVVIISKYEDKLAKLTKVNLCS